MFQELLGALGMASVSIKRSSNDSECTHSGKTTILPFKVMAEYA